MKRVLLVGLVIVLSFGLVGCGPFSSDSNDSGDEIVWKTYEIALFSFKYPGSWYEVDEFSDYGVASKEIMPSEEDLIDGEQYQAFDVFEEILGLYQGKTFEEVIEEDLEKEPLLDFDDKKEIEISGYQAYKIEGYTEKEGISQAHINAYILRDDTEYNSIDILQYISIGANGQEIGREIIDSFQYN